MILSTCLPMPILAMFLRHQHSAIWCIILRLVLVWDRASKQGAGGDPKIPELFQSFTLEVSLGFPEFFFVGHFFL